MKIVFEPASNGIIKTIIDENINGNDEVYSETSVYEIPDANEIYPHNNLENLKKVSNILSEFLDDMSLNIGNKHSIYKLSFLIEKNDDMLTTEDIDKKIQYYEELAEQYRGLKNEEKS